MGHGAGGEFDRGSVLDAMERGDFYASTGVELQDYAVDERRITIAIKARATEKYRVLFIGRGGQVLKEALESPATYEFAGTEGYVRAKVVDSNGRTAWTQPVLTGRRDEVPHAAHGPVLP